MNNTKFLYLPHIVLLHVICISSVCGQVDTIQLPGLNIDSLTEASQEKGYFTQVATTMPFNAPWQSEMSKQHLIISIPNATGIAFLVKLKKADKLLTLKFFNNSGDTLNILDNITENTQKLTDFILGDIVHIIVEGKGNVDFRSILSIERVFPAFRQLPSHHLLQKKGLYSDNEVHGLMGSCDRDVICETDRDYAGLSSGVVRIQVVHQEGIGFCSGALMNNTSKDRTPYILTGFHCMDGYTPLYSLWKFDFYYQLEECENGDVDARRMTISGCTEISGWRNSDFLLLKLSESIPDYLPIKFYGWDATEKIPQSSYVIHHPQGDVKKISIDNDPSKIIPNRIVWNSRVTTPPNYHFKLDFDTGSQEGGSSGAPHFDENDRVVAQLNGGKANCVDQFLAYNGRMFYSWEGGGTSDTRLKDWLDPLNEMHKVFDGMTHIPETRKIVFVVRNPIGKPMQHVEIELNGVRDTVDASGVVFFDSLLRSQVYTFYVRHLSGNIINGLSARDVNSLTRYLLDIDTFPSDFIGKLCDVNQDGNFTIEDRDRLIEIIILEQRYMPKNWLFSSSNGKFEVPVENRYATTIEITAYKVGDYNHTADPSK